MRRRTQLRQLQGRIVGMALATGARIDECHLISSRPRCRHVWVFENGKDVFIPVDDIRDCWEVSSGRAA